MTTLIDAFYAAAKAHPAQTAVEADGQAHSYAKLCADAQNVACGLIKAGVNPKDYVGIHLGRSYELVLVHLGVLMAGATLLPLDSKAPKSRNTAILAAAGVRHWVGDTPRDLSGTFMDIAQLTQPQPRHDLPPLSAETPAIIYHTSGTTGTPKGVLVPHQGILRMAQRPDYISVGPTDRVLNLSNPAFDANSFELWAALLNGACLCVINPEDDPAQAIVAAQPTVGFITTSLFQILLAQSPACFASFHAVLFGGEASNPDILRRFMAAHPKAPRFIHVYGPTETTTFALSFPIPRGFFEPAPAAIPIGKPIRETGVELVVNGTRRAKPDEVGEIYLSGSGLAQGYLNEPALNAAAFVPLPWAGKALFYKTGDLGRIDSAGNITFLGRADRQVKIRGFRVELAEIEALLTPLNGVEQAAVLVRRSAQNTQDIYAFVQGTAQPEALLASLAKSLPAYALPHHIEMVTTLPVNANGKLDHSALFDQLKQPRPPQSALPEALLQTVISVLGHANIDDHKSFIALGGDSLKATVLRHRLQKDHGLAVSDTALLDAPALSQLLRSAPPATAAFTTENSAQYPASAEQVGLWLQQMAAPDSTAYSVPLVLHLSGTVNEAALEQALAYMLARHGALRSCFYEENGALWVQEQPFSGFALKRGPDGAFFETPFTLDGAPLLRAQLEGTTLRLNFHHIAVDGQSLNLFFAELNTAYSAFCAGITPGLAPIAATYGAYATWQNQQRSSAPYQENRRALAAHLGAPTISYGPPALGKTGARHTVQLSAQQSQRLQSLCEAQNTTLFSQLYRCFARAYAQGTSPVQIGVPVGNRPDGRLQHTLGMFVNTTVYRGEALTPHLNEVAYIDVVEQLGQSGALFEAMFVLENTALQNVVLGDLAVDIQDPALFEPRFPFTLFVFPESDGLRFSYEYDTALFSTYAARHIAARMQAEIDHLFAPAKPLALLEALANAPDTATAVTYGNTHLSYSDLRAQSDRVAGMLAAKGLGAGDLVGILMPRSDQLLVALLGVLKAGAAYVPLDPESPETRLNDMIKDAGIALILSDQPAGLSAPVLPINHWADQKQAKGPNQLSERAYVMFTSGSTGAPKGVEISHENLNTYLRHALGYFDGPMASAVVSSAFTFDATITTLLGPLMCGKTVYILPQDGQEIPHLAKIMQQDSPRLFKITPAHIPALLAYLSDTSPTSHRFIIGGEALKTPVLQRFARLFPNAVFVNEYGPTEATVGCCIEELTAAEVGNLQSATVPIGRSINGVELSIDEKSSELLIGGAGVGLGYLNHPEQSAQKFAHGLYHSGDTVARLPGGRLRYDGRMDDQINLNGYRIEPAEIEAAIETIPEVESAVISTQTGPTGEAQLIAHCKGTGLSSAAIRSHLAAQLPAHMLPQHIEIVGEIPLTSNGKIDRTRLASPPPTGLQAQILAAFEAVLGYPVQADQHFFEAGAGSLALMKIHAALIRETDVELQLVDFFQHPTVHQLAAHLADTLPPEPAQARTVETDTDVAIIGMAISVATAPSLALFAQLAFGTTSGIAPLKNASAGRVPVASILEDPFGFDPDYFGISRKDARLMDPQQRHLLMGAVQALENAGMRPDQARIGCLMSSSENTYHLQQVNASSDFHADRAPLAMQNEKDFLASRIAYQLGLTGPAFTVQSACSSSLLGVHQACMMLHHGEADSVIVGGIAIDQMTFEGYQYREGGILSKSGACTPFSDKADGTVPGNGYGMVVLKPLAKARADGNRIYAIIKGSAINNDGKNKVGFTAPSVEGQAAVIRDALQKAALKPDDISYLEAHGTATNLGDQIEVQALKRVFETNGRVALSSVKSQIGHLGAGAGIAGLIRAALAVFQGQIPPNHGFTAPNPALGLDTSSLYVPAAASPWPTGPRYAGVSSFGLGGTNVHVVLGQEPHTQGAASTRPACLTLSAHSEAALSARVADLSTYLAGYSDGLAPLALHLQTGQNPRPWRVAIVASSPEEAMVLLKSARPQLAPPDSTPMPVPAPAPNIAQAFLAGQSAHGPASPDAPWDLPPYAFDLIPLHAEHTSPRLPFEKWFLQPNWVRHGPALKNGCPPDMVWDGQDIAPTGPPLHIWFKLPAQPLAFALARLGALMAALGPRQAHVLVITTDACAIGPAPARTPEHAAIGAAINVLAQEHPALRLTHLDLESGYDLSAVATSNLLAGASLALRNGMFWQAQFAPVIAGAPVAALQKGGVYLVTGGTGGIGQHLEKMIKAADATALTVARSAPDPKLRCDIADPAQMASLAAHLQKTHGRISGVFHGAGVAGGGLLHQQTAAAIEQNMRAKLEGFKQLITHIAPLTDDFILSLSSMSAIIGARGQADYAAANAAIDALSLAAKAPPLVMSINLPTWQNTGMAAGLSAELPQGFADYALTPAEGIRAITQALAHGLPQVAVSPLPLEAVAALVAKPTPAGGSVHAIFCEALGLDSCDKDTSFNELGGDSLASLDVLEGLNASFNLGWSAADLGADFTIGALEARLMAPRHRMASADLVLVHPIGGDIGCYRGLQNALGGLNISLIEDPFIADTAAPPLSLEARAASYIKQLPQGDFWLGGWSFGAVVAFEMARQLEQAGRAPKGLLMIDPPAPERTALPDTSALEQSFKAEIIAQTGQSLNQNHPHFRKIVSACTRNTHALAAYIPAGPVRCPTQLIMAGPRRAVEQSWQALAPTTLTRLNADHYSILRPPALSLLAQHILELAQPEKEKDHV